MKGHSFHSVLDKTMEMLAHQLQASLSIYYRKEIGNSWVIYAKPVVRTKNPFADDWHVEIFIGKVNRMKFVQVTLHWVVRNGTSQTSLQRIIHQKKWEEDEGE